MSNEIVLASNQLAARVGVEKSHMLATIKAQCFKCDPDKVSDTQLAAFVSIANEMGVNPLLPGMLFAFPDGRGGIVPMMGPDGVMKKLAEMKGVTYECIVYPEDVMQAPTHATAKIYVEGKERPYTYTAVYSEWATSNWSKKPRHWNWLRALKQCARQVIHGLPMDEEEVTLGGMVNVTETGDQSQPAAERASPPPRRGGAAAAAASAKKDAEPAAEAPKPAKSEAIEVEVVAEPTKAEKPAPAPKAEPKPEPVAAPKAEEKPAAPIVTAPPAPDLGTVPEVCAGVSAVGFHGKKWPIIITATVNGITDKPKAARPHKVINVTSNAPAESTFDIVCFETVEGLAAEVVIEFSGEAKLRPGPVVDGKKTTDYTKAPAIIATGVKLAELTDF